MSLRYVCITNHPVKMSHFFVRPRTPQRSWGEEQVTEFATRWCNSTSMVSEKLSQIMFRNVCNLHIVWLINVLFALSQLRWRLINKEFNLSCNYQITVQNKRSASCDAQDANNIRVFWGLRAWRHRVRSTYRKRWWLTMEPNDKS